MSEQRSSLALRLEEMRAKHDQRRATRGSSASASRSAVYQTTKERPHSALCVTDMRPLRERSTRGPFTSPSYTPHFDEWHKERHRRAILPAGKLPKAWQPVKDDYDDCTTHTLWRLEDGQNSMVMDAREGQLDFTQTLTSQLSVGDVAGEVDSSVWGYSAENATGLSPLLTAASAPQMSSAPIRNGGFASSAPTVVSPSKRPESGDVLTRRYLKLRMTGEMGSDMDQGPVPIVSPMKGHNKYGQGISTNTAGTDSQNFARALRASQEANREDDTPLDRLEPNPSSLPPTSGIKVIDAPMTNGNTSMKLSSSVMDVVTTPAAKRPTSATRRQELSMSMSMKPPRPATSDAAAKRSSIGSNKAGSMKRPTTSSRLRFVEPLSASATSFSGSVSIGARPATAPRTNSIALTPEALRMVEAVPQRAAESPVVSRPATGKRPSVVLEHIKDVLHNQQFPLRSQNRRENSVNGAESNSPLMGESSPPPGVDEYVNIEDSQVAGDITFTNVEGETMMLSEHMGSPNSTDYFNFWGSASGNGHSSSMQLVKPEDTEDLWEFEVNKIVGNSRMDVRGLLEHVEPSRSPFNKSLGISNSNNDSLISPTHRVSFSGNTPTYSRHESSYISNDKASYRLRRKLMDLERQAPKSIPRITLQFFDVSDLSIEETHVAMGQERHIEYMTPRTRNSFDEGMAEPRLQRGLKRRGSFTDFLNNEDMCEEKGTFFPPQELHLYQMYCANTSAIIIFRPVSPAVPSMYAGNAFIPRELCDKDGIPLMCDEIDENLTLDDILSFTTFESRVKGKGIGVSLKSSPYAPIEGFIPVNPHLSKTYSEAQRKERLLEEKLMNSNSLTAVSNSTSLLKKIRSQRSNFSTMTAVAMREIEQSMEASDKKLKMLFQSYKSESMYTRKKLPVAQKFIDELNESQFLGKTHAQWRGMFLYFRQVQGKEDIERIEGGHPIFYCRRGTSVFNYSVPKNELDQTTEQPFNLMKDELRPVEILTHRSFIISKESERIEEDPGGDFIIGPDFDGLAYAHKLPRHMELDEYVKFCDSRIDFKLVPSMGLVSDIDVEHVLDMRRMTEWKQNHGYESGNTIKTQELTDGSYVVITPKGVKVANSFSDVIDIYRESWQMGFPLLMNPNWRVVIDPKDNLPNTLGDDVALPIIDDCGMAFIKDRASDEGVSIEMLKSKVDGFFGEALSRQQKIAQMKASGELNIRIPRLAYSELEADFALVVKKKQLAEHFYSVRRWMLMPPFEKGFITDNQLDFMSRTVHRHLPERGEFEKIRKKRVAELLKKFDLEAALFEQAFQGEGIAFVARLRMFLIGKERRRRRTSGSFGTSSVGDMSASLLGRGRVIRKELLQLPDVGSMSADDEEEEEEEER